MATGAKRDNLFVMEDKLRICFWPALDTPCITYICPLTGDMRSETAVRELGFAVALRSVRMRE